MNSVPLISRPALNPLSYWGSLLQGAVTLESTMFDSVERLSEYIGQKMGVSKALYKKYLDY